MNEKMQEMVAIEPSFQKSVNIGYDIFDDKKLKNFIPTRPAMDLLEEILMSVENNNSERARIMIGAYGKGKSHIVLVILAILALRKIELFEKLLPKIQENPRLSKLIDKHYNGKKKLLPVVINGSNCSLTQSFLIALQRTLSENNLMNIMPETNYLAAIQVIERWEKDYPSTFKQFTKKIKEPPEKFIDKLGVFEVAAYEKFEKIYPTLTSGSLFNPFLNFDVTEIYESVVKSLRLKGYAGIFVVYDEFSKYLESNIQNVSISDTKALQDFAEKCSRSGDLQLHLLLISHKEISNYIDVLPKEKTDGWRGVSERFKHIHLNNNFSQTYEIISSIIKHNGESWKKFVKTYGGNFEHLCNRYQNSRMFQDSKSNVGKIIFDGFPLHPVSIFILPRLSEKIAQNERTIFTFLSAEGNFTLSDFLSKCRNDFELLTPDWIYDYFEPILRREINSGEMYNVFNLTCKVLEKVSEETLESKIIKTLSLIYILEKFEQLAPTKEQIVETFSTSYAISEIESAINSLIEKDFVVYLKRSNNYLCLKKTSGVDVRQKIHDWIQTHSGKVSPTKILSAVNFDSYIYPARYNEEHAMTRFFAFKFIAGENVLTVKDWYSEIEKVNADGVIYGIIPDDENQRNEIENLLVKKKKFCERVIFVLPKNFVSIDKVVLEYAAVCDLRDRAVNDIPLFEEYEVIFEDLQEVVKKLIYSYTRPENNSSMYINDGKIFEIQRKSELTELMSKICDAVYKLTPIINNEMINKNEITSVAQKSRNKIIGALLRNELEKNLGFIGSGQEVSILRSTLIRTKVLIENNGETQISPQKENRLMFNVLKEIENFILSANKKSKRFNKIYEILTSPKFNIGLRRGVIPIYLAAVFHNYRQKIVISNRVGNVPINVDTLIQINSKPEKFKIEYIDWNDDKENYIKQLEKIFSDYVIAAEKKLSYFDCVANALQRWYISLPKFSRESLTLPNGKKIPDSAIQMMQVIGYDNGGADLLLKKLPDAFDCEKDFSAIAKNVLSAKNLFDGMIIEWKIFLIDETKNIILRECDKNFNNEKNLLEVIGKWLESLDQNIWKRVFQDGTNNFLRQLKNAPEDEETFIVELTEFLTGLKIEYWNAETPAQYFTNLKKFIDTAKNFNNNEITGEDCELKFSDETGTKIIRKFEKVEITPKGKLLFNKVTDSLDSMGQSISMQEKRQVLFDILKNLC